MSELYMLHFVSIKWHNVREESSRDPIISFSEHTAYLLEDK